MVRRGSFIGGQDNLSVPDAPTIGAATAGNTQVSVAFTAPSDVGDDPITSFGVSVFPATGTTKTFRVTVASGNLYGGGTGNVFYIDGVSNPALTLVKGFTYVFDQEDSSNSGHPLHFKDTGGSQYSTGVTVTNTAGQSGAKVTLVLAEDASEPSAYYCTAHGNGMGNTITLVAPSASDDPLGQAQYSNTGSSSPIVVTGLTNDTSYVAKAWAINDYGNGPLSAATSSFTPVLPTPGVDFDGTNDYLNRTSDLSGNADGKTFTFSTFVYLAEDTNSTFLNVATSGGSGRLNFAIDDSQKLIFEAYNSSGTRILNLESRAANGGGMALNTWTHILLSVDLANSSNRHLYVNDVVPTHVDFDTYTDGTIDFTNPKWGVGGSSAGGSVSKMRFGGLYLDYTYRDLSTTSNRRLFVDANGLYVAPPTSGILSLAMTNATSVATNSGTGGDFTLNGTVAQSGRNALQYNPSAVVLNASGSSDFLRSSSTFSAISTKTVTWSIIAKRKSSTNFYVFGFDNNSTIYGYISWYDGAVVLKNSSGTVILNIGGIGGKFGTQTQGRFIQLDFSCDLTDTSKRHVIVDGEDLTSSVTFSTYTNDNISIQNAFFVGGFFAAGNSATSGEVSRIWFDDSYKNLSSDNPFYDTSTDKAKDVGADGSTPTGSSPLVYLPMLGTDAGKNYGTDSDFTVNSGPYTGARGPNEFNGDSFRINGSSSNYLHRDELSGISNGKAFTIAFAHKTDTDGSHVIFELHNGTSFCLEVRNDPFERIGIKAGNGSGEIMEVKSTVGDLTAAAGWHTLVASFDLSDTSKRHLYINGASDLAAVNRYDNDTIDFTANEVTIGADYNGGSAMDGEIGFFYFDTTYIDLSQETNRLKFFDAFNYPVDLGSNGSTPTGSQPLIYMNKGFKNGTNLGSGGNFTVVGSDVLFGGHVRG